MISLSIKTYTHVHEHYVVKLGNGTVHEFSNEKKCKKFLVKSSKFLTKRYNRLNLIFADVFSLYRQVYFYFDDNRDKRHSELYADRRQVNALISYVEKQFEQLTFIGIRSDGNFLVFPNLYSLIESLIEILLIIRKLNSKKSYAATEIRCDFLINQLQECKAEIQNYSLNSATSFDSAALTSQNSQSITHLSIVS
ncbi:hypothetical protein [Draconibacterium halophilum]|uniref:Uncharacterized protein n=1 Tax=Draconibacterium halophilum TaxID=2706887 RepID=A0A6C0RCP4_9BACT|nr:hypothetical protein [Draconibacterium halophilum]QIA08264.1 hypothetical protein G0Q07_11300 [Draconibacterium halophilum]